MKDVLEIVRRLLEEEALGQRIVALGCDRPYSLFGFHDIEAICRFALPKHLLAIRLTFFGRDLDRSACLDRDGFYDFVMIDRLHRGGATVIVNEIHNFSGSVHRLKRQLEKTLHCPIGVNCYATPMNAQGLARHVDSHDVVILQLQGRKRWQLFDRAPRAGGDYTMDGFPHDAACDERVLAPGDVLYIPAGFVHAAKSVDGATSLHLTVGFSRPTWKTLLEAWVNTAAKDDLTLTSEIPAAMLRRDASVEECDGLARAALDRVATTPFADALRRVVGYESPGSGVEVDATGADVAFDTLTADTPLSKAPGVTAELFAGALRIQAASGRLLELKRECEHAWADIDRRTAFRPRDLAGRLPEGTETLFCYYLLNNGLLTPS